MNEKKYQLPREFAERWVAALRSGEYKQTTKGLYDNVEDSYCCLGVACKLQGVENMDMIGIGEICELSQSYEGYEDLIEQYAIPYPLITGDLPGLFIYLNDGRYEGKKMIEPTHTFPEIADWIESNVEFV